MEGKEIDEVTNFTRKDKAERFLNKLFRGTKESRQTLSILGTTRLFQV